MYLPDYYRNTNLTEIKSFIRNHPFATIITNGMSEPVATHIPIELIENNNEIAFLQGHISRANTQWKNFTENNRALVIFHGPHSYVSSGWYNHKNVPTWNYIAVHVTGKIKIIEGDDLYKSLKGLVDRYEGGSANPVRIEDIPGEMIDKYMKGIVGFRIEMEKIEGKWKLSQNRDDEDFRSIINELEKINDVNSKLVAEEMRKLKIED